MTLSTDVFIHDEIDPQTVFDYCSLLINAPTNAEWKEDEDSIHMAPGQGFCAWLLVYRAPNGARQTEPIVHWEDCEADCDYHHEPAHWVKVNFDTAYGYRGDDGEGCGGLHAKLVAQLGKWLDSKGVEWSWENEFTGEIHKGYESLKGLVRGGKEANAWFADVVVPVIAAEFGGKS